MTNSVSQGNRKATLAIHKLTSCSGCQAVILNLGEDLLTLLEQVEILHFVEGGIYQPDAKVDIALVEGSVSTPDDQIRLNAIREHCQLLIAVGACACSGGVQALRNVKQSDDWAASVYADKRYIDSLSRSHAIADCTKVDFELWGCPISGRQILAALSMLLRGVSPISPTEKLCQECKRRQQVCVVVTQGEPCMGPVTRAGCGALCPQFGAPCYTCFGPSEQPNMQGLARRFQALGLPPQRVAERFVSISAGAPAFADAYRDLMIDIAKTKD
ncbi:hypothetical protein ACFSJ3_04670 [Corallincola platygyrae]|uniref:NADH:ubiquinone oxidoreductase-like 20kDa subunit domain-containing protein n=1 Tax=Corallincola platygyrae TaxID=1193278 RepID=A0ABW4XMM3_9GAMM